MELIVCGQVVRADSDNVFLKSISYNFKNIKMYSPEFVFGEALEHLDKKKVVGHFCVRNKKEIAFNDFLENKHLLNKEEGILYSSSSEIHLDMDFFVKHSVSIDRFSFGDFLSNQIGKFFFLHIEY